MVYYKLILNDKRQKSDGIYPVVLWVTFNGNNTTITSGIRLKNDDCDNNAQSVRRKNPNFQSFNQSLSDENEFSFEALKEKLEEKSKPSKINTGTTYQKV